MKSSHVLVTCVVLPYLFTIVYAALVCDPDSNGNVDFSRGNGNFQGITALDNTTFDSCLLLVNNITSLDLSYNNITDVAGDTFNIFYNLQTLNLSHNKIQQMAVETFNSVRKLEQLDLSFNQLSELRAGLLDNIHLISVWFNNNNISYVEPGIVSEINVALLYFNMNYNSMTYLDPWPYLTYQEQNRDNDRFFLLQHNNIQALTNYMNWSYNLEYPFEVEVETQFNDIQTLSVDTIRQYQPNVSDDSVFALLLTFYINITNNNFFCDCQVYDIAATVRGGIFRYSRVDEYRYICAAPSHLEGWDYLHDLPLDQLVCNYTVDCPNNCFCQDRPHNDTFFIDCTNAGLTEMPQTIPQHSRSKIEIILDNNRITQLKNTNYLPLVYNISLNNNRISSLDSNVLTNLEAKKVDLRNNNLKTIPVEVKKFESIQLTGNPLECDCDSMWIKEWMDIDTNNADPDLTCEAKTGSHHIMEMTLDDLGCTNKILIIICVCLGVFLALVVVALIFAKRCPYETKVLLHRIFRIHPRDKYKVDKDDGKEVDIYLVYDDKDPEVIGYLRYFMHTLNKKKPLYSVLNPARFMEAGSERNNIDKYIGKSRRVVIFLSKGIFENGWRQEEIEEAEHRQVEAVTMQNKAPDTIVDVEGNENVETETTNTEPKDVQVDIGEENTENLDQSPKIIYIIYNHDVKLQTTLESEPWKTRLAGKTVLRPDPDDKWFWSKIRYELPPKGNGIGDGTYMPFVREPLKGEVPRPNIRGPRAPDIRPDSPKNPKAEIAKGKFNNKYRNSNFDNARNVLQILAKQKSSNNRKKVLSSHERISAVDSSSITNSNDNSGRSSISTKGSSSENSRCSDMTKILPVLNGLRNNGGKEAGRVHVVDRNAHTELPDVHLSFSRTMNNGVVSSNLKSSSQSSNIC